MSRSTSASASRATSDTPHRREKTDFAKAGPCPNGAACPEHPFLACWTFGIDWNDDVIALAPKKGPFCRYNHSREADGELTSVQLSRRKLISDAKKRIRLEKAATGAANIAEEEGEEAQLSVDFGLPNL